MLGTTDVPDQDTVQYISHEKGGKPFPFLWNISIFVLVSQTSTSFLQVQAMSGMDTEVETPVL